MSRSWLTTCEKRHNNMWEQQLLSSPPHCWALPTLFNRKKYLNPRRMFSHKTFYTVKKKLVLKSWHFYKTCILLRKTSFSHRFTFQPCGLITPRWGWHIYFGPRQIWTWSEKCAIALSQINWPRLLEIIGLLADSRWT